MEGVSLNKVPTIVNSREKLENTSVGNDMTPVAELILCSVLSFFVSLLGRVISGDGMKAEQSRG